MKIAIFLLALLPVCSSALTVKAYREMREVANKTVPPGQVNVLDEYIRGVGNGIMWSNAAALLKFGQPLFCPPDKLSLNGANFRSIMETVIDEETAAGLPNEDKKAVEDLMLIGLDDMFPCAKGKK